MATWAAKVHRAPRHHNRRSRALSVSANAESPVEPAQLMQGMRESITEALQPAKLDIQDINGSCLAQAAFLQPSYACFPQIWWRLLTVAGDGRHVSIDVVSEVFEGESSVKRQRMVYKVSCGAQVTALMPC